MPIGPDESVRGILVYWVTQHNRVAHADPKCDILGLTQIGQVEQWAVWKKADVVCNSFCKKCGDLND